MIIFLGGKRDRREFLGLVRDTRETAARFGATLLERDGFTADVTLRRVDFFLLLRSFPNEFCVQEVERLRRASPLAPIAIVAGKLCESEERTGERFLGARRFYVNEWRETGRYEFIRFFDVHGASGFFAESPLTSDVELRAHESQTAALREERTLILSDDTTIAEFLATMFKSYGLSVRAQSLEALEYDALSDYLPSRVIVDAARFVDKQFIAQVRSARERYPGACLELLLFSPTESEIEFFEDYQRWGRTRVLAKPFEIASLLSPRG